MAARLKEEKALDAERCGEDVPGNARWFDRDEVMTRSGRVFKNQAEINQDGHTHSRDRRLQGSLLRGRDRPDPRALG